MYNEYLCQLMSTIQIFRFKNFLQNKFKTLNKNNFSPLQKK